MDGRSPFLEETIELTPGSGPGGLATPFLEVFEGLPEGPEEDEVLETDPGGDDVEIGQIEEGEARPQVAEGAPAPPENTQAAGGQLDEELSAIAETQDVLESDYGAESAWEPELRESGDLLEQRPEAARLEEFSTFVFEGPERSEDELIFELDFEGEPVEEAFVPTAVETPGGGRIADKRPPDAVDLVTVTGLSGKRVQLHRLAAAAWRAMAADARTDEIAEPLLVPASGYRSVERQRELWESALRKYGSPDVARRWVAPPGSSPHHSGRAIDLWLGMKIASENAATMRNAPAYRWLAANAERFGFYPYEREPWHWEYNPASAGAPPAPPTKTPSSPGVPAPATPTGAGVTFPSGATLPIVAVEAPEGSEHHDPNSTRNPLLDTGPANRALHLAPNFTVAEFARSGGRIYDRARIDPALVRCLQALRDLAGKPVRITSGYRSSAHNEAIYRARGKAATRSRHSSGQAADVRIDGMTGLQIAMAAIDGCGCDLGLGVGADYAHIDVRGRFTRWAYMDGPAGTDVLEQLAAYRARRCASAEVEIGSAETATGAVIGGALGGPFGAAIGTAFGGVVDAATAAASGLPGWGSPDAATAEAPCGITYHPVPGREFGPRFGGMRPPGLPGSARQSSARDAAVSHIEQAGRSLVPSPIFERTVVHLARTESGGMFGRPANIFDARPPAGRPPGKGLITAWGAFQFNRDAWRGLPETPNGSFPWNSTPCQEILWPLRQYARLLEEVRVAGGSEVDAARGIRLWHSSPVAYRRYLQAGRTSGRFDTAWQAVEEARRRRVDQHLRDAGIIP
jgi:LAS superfamily LD-carboxypeptidase LdcB/uncharacterized protein YcbK (DUF882 family)